MFSERLLDHFESPRNAGDLEAASARVRVENPICGDELQLAVRVVDGTVVEARYLARGCTASIAVGSALTELLSGKSVSTLDGLDSQELEQAVDGLPSTSKHAAVLAVDAVRALAAELAAE